LIWLGFSWKIFIPIYDIKKNASKILIWVGFSWKIFCSINAQKMPQKFWFKKISRSFRLEILLNSVLKLIFYGKINVAVALKSYKNFSQECCCSLNVYNCEKTFYGWIRVIYEYPILLSTQQRYRTTQLAWFLSIFMTFSVVRRSQDRPFSVSPLKLDVFED